MAISNLAAAENHEIAYGDSGSNKQRHGARGASSVARSKHGGARNICGIKTASKNSARMARNNNKSAWRQNSGSIGGRKNEKNNMVK